MTWDELSVNRSSFDCFTSPIHMCHCEHCGACSFWYKDIKRKESFILYPEDATAPLAHPDMPEDMRIDFEEARQIASISPRGAAALLRLSIQKLCKELGGKGDNINADIAALVSKGLPSEIQQALDIVRVVGNNAVHPGELSTGDVTEVCNALFDLINHIVEDQIARPKRLTALFERLPKGAIESIDKRDQKALAST